MITDTDTKPEPLTLGRIAHWYTGTILDEKSKKEVEAITTGIVRASVPILQRGLVWRPQQIELLWDSILRGFPVGALVLCLKIKEQAKESDDNATHHILDGQQRCNAISLGFTDPFPEGFQEHQREPVPSILWLDLNPTRPDGSTREYFARLTTSAHPWGYGPNDNADRISANDIRKALGGVGKPTSQPGYKRPLPEDMSPYFSNAPVPLAWLMSADISSNEDFWKHINTRLESLNTFEFKWVSKTIEYLAKDDKDAVQSKKYLFDGILRARNATIVALMAPKGLLDKTARESHDNGLETTQNRTDISNIEHLFQRLNRQGTQLDGEELAYSMIKAYWPELAKPVDEISPRHMPASRIVALGVRIALADNNKDHLPSALGVSQIRAMANKKDFKILDFITGKEGHGTLFKANAQVDKWLRYFPKSNKTGFIPLQITRFAMSSPEVYLLLLWMAHRTMNDPALQDNLHKPVQALASWMHWFSNDKGKAASCIYSQCNGTNSFSIGAFKEAIRIVLDNENSFMAAIPTKDNFAAFLKLPQSDIDNWNWWDLVKDEQQIDEARKQILEQVVYRIIGNKEILLYAQRDYLNSQFENYDPSDKDMWQDYNCPWDYDHILAHSYVYNRRGKSFQRFCTKWVTTIGNFRAWPLEENRSDQAEKANHKIDNDTKRLNSFLLSKEIDPQDSELSVFSSEFKILDDQEAALRFADTCWKRISRIYGEWYDSVGITDLLPANTQSPTIPTSATENSQPSNFQP